MKPLVIAPDTYKEESLILLKGGHLIETKWYGPKDEEDDDSYINQDTDKGHYFSKDVTDHAIRYIYDYCKLDTDYTLKDFFLFLDNDIDFFDSIFGNWLKDLTMEALSGIKSNDNDFVKRFDYLELYWIIESDNYDEESLSGLRFPDFHGMGTVQPGDPFGKVGDAESLGVSMTPSYDLIDLPLKLSKELLFCISRKSKNATNKQIHKSHKFKNPCYTLGHIIQGIVWEMSFYGGPEQRQVESAEINSRMREIKSYPVDYK